MRRGLVWRFGPIEVMRLQCFFFCSRVDSRQQVVVAQYHEDCNGFPRIEVDPEKSARLTHYFGLETHHRIYLRITAYHLIIE
jgi:hypothetical protein